MTGKRLYDLACLARKAQPYGTYGSAPQHVGAAPWTAWIFLHSYERDFWNDLAKRVTPRRRSA